MKRKVSFHESTNENEKEHKDNIPMPAGHPVKLDEKEIEDEWAYKANKKDKNQKKKLKGGSSRGHEKILDDMHKAYNDKKQKEKQILLDKEAKKKADYEKKKEEK